MQQYNATVRIGGSPLHEVPRIGLTAPEVICLRAVHGDDAVVNIKQGTVSTRTQTQERDRLRQVYGPEVVSRLFGDTYEPRLPVRLDDVEGGDSGSDPDSGSDEGEGEGSGEDAPDAKKGGMFDKFKK